MSRSYIWGLDESPVIISDHTIMVMMKRNFIFLLLAVVLTALSGCSKTTGPEVSYFVVKVDSITVPDSISRSDTLKIRLYGTIGNNGNYSFDRYEATRDSYKLNLTVWGKHVDNDVATMVMVLLDGAEYPVYPVYPNKFKIFIRQPDSSILSDSVMVQ
ncbi:hypothetical protein HY768_10410 [candidate division TA06 bacterium]|uniref:Uncharacterized protein n=1 Tax=candidate division TA06 bacterium TaxID=2250710 RepID=A0A933MKD9_UNCT6|nr:hypothetical protein [candidate division TA06 bacterium]